MEWRRRLVELAIASGGLSGCGSSQYVCGNANPDQCICGRMPADSPQCVAEKTCTDKGDFWEFDDPAQDGLEGHCSSWLPDAAIDAPAPDADLRDADLRDNDLEARDRYVR